MLPRSTLSVSSGCRWIGPGRLRLGDHLDLSHWLATPWFKVTGSFVSVSLGSEVCEIVVLYLASFGTTLLGVDRRSRVKMAKVFAFRLAARCLAHVSGMTALYKIFDSTWTRV